MWVEDVRLHFGLELVLYYSCKDGSREAAGPEIFMCSLCGLRSYQRWDGLEPWAGTSPYSCMVGHYSHGMYSQFRGNGTNQVTLAGAGERPVCFLPSLSLVYAPVHLSKDREHIPALIRKTDIILGEQVPITSTFLCLDIDCNHTPMNQALTRHKSTPIIHNWLQSFRNSGLVGTAYFLIT